MKPINLKIRGLNSFEEEQEVDFIALTRGGFFGIFGPTGSGKSTILDGITLALYGDVSRNSADFINANCEKAQVSFKFQISGKENKIYLVQRDFKRDKNSLKPRTDKCKVMDITTDEVVVLEESVKGVTEKCSEIIGLSRDDFTRTVVLPQGKFSDFLKMEGKNRRDMLERLFNLQEYGDNLRQKLKGRLDKETATKTSLEGEIRGLGEVSKEIIADKEKEYDAGQKDLALKKEELTQINQLLETSKEVYKLQKEFDKHKAEHKALLNDKSLYENKNIELEKRKNANALAIYIQDFEGTQKDKIEIAQQLDAITEKLQKANEMKIQRQKDFESAKEKYELILPGLRLQEQKILEALEEEKELHELQTQSELLKSSILALESRLREADGTKQTLTDKASEIGKMQEMLALEIIDTKVDASVKEKVRIGEKLAEGVSILSENVNKIQGKIIELSELQSEYDIQRKRAEGEKNDSEESLKKLSIQLDVLKQNRPGSLEDLSAIKDNLYELKSKWSKHEEIHTAIKQSENLVTQHKQEKAPLEQTFKELTLQLEQIDIKINENKNSAMAHELRKSLSEGEPCPVCGSKDHYPEKVKPIDLNNLEKLELEKERLTEKLKKTETAINERKVLLSIEEEKTIGYALDLDKLGKEYLSQKPEDQIENYNHLKQLIETYEKELNNLTTEISSKTNTITKQAGELNTIDAKLSSVTIQQADNREEVKKSRMELDEKQKALTLLINETGIDDFILASQIIREKDEHREKLESALEAMVTDEKKIKKELEILESSIKEFSDQLIVANLDLKNKRQQVDRLINSIVKKAGTTENLFGLRDEVDQKINEIVRSYNILQEANQKSMIDFDSISNQFSKIAQSFSDIEKRFEIVDKTIKKKLGENKFTSLDEAKGLLTDEKSILTLETEINEYNDALSRKKGILESIEKKLDGHQISEEKWQEIQNQQKEKETIFSLLHKDLALLEKEIKDDKDKLSSIKDLADQIKNIDDRLGILRDLESLFKGNRFVEFIATERLKYISREASARLLDITGGIYGLETDDEGRFLIKDNKNGGILRESSTLSGGETFLTSLALALALSAEIQLKGTAPLELFFLDEGFGTLDDNLLDVVMTSLERIHHEKLKVGIISHVESVKNRVPVKLIVTSAVTGESGSKVRIELN